MIEEKTCYNCGNKNCIVYYSTAKKDCKRHYETYEYTNFECVNHDKWEEMKVEEIRTDNTETLKNALTALEEENVELKDQVSFLKDNLRVARKDREDLQLDVAKGLKEFVKDYPATALRYLANEKYVELFDKAKELLNEFMRINKASDEDFEHDYSELIGQTETFLQGVNYV